MTLYVIKIGDQYLTADGDLSPSQKDGVRISQAQRLACTFPTIDGVTLPRFVKIRPRSSQD